MKEAAEISTLLSTDEHALIHHIAMLPHKILSHHEVDGLSDLVLHELGHEEGFGLKRAIYLVDNPDFDHLKGIAGFCRNECCLHQKDVWHNPHSFKQDMAEAPFHVQVQKLLQQSLKRKDIDLTNHDDIHALGRAAGMDQPQHLSWPLPYGNHGLLLFEHAQQPDDWRQRLFGQIAALIGLCGIH